MERYLAWKDNALPLDRVPLAHAAGTEQSALAKVRGNTLSREFPPI